ncbi:hypothetical protein RQP53_19495 [Paucibacter sp. APW11]|uniref:Uncharacterized protein n=1 Tax=Roseateles aquae TaxID=3077235 RepID=A0ABU3PFU7_9BURK|nr:hypothetical protein [Paucibacter sp. APW11]MDT9001470.1 hypothetical protein [Paucibacter sp. APW11]
MLEVPKFIKPVGGEKAPPWFHIAVALSMVLSAAASLVGALRTSETMKELVNQNARMVRASSTPILQFNTRRQHSDTDVSFTLELNNVGTGLAQVAWFELLLDGKPVSSGDTLVQLLRAAPSEGGQAIVGGNYSRASITDTVIAAKEQTQLFQWGVSKRSAAELEQINQQIKQLKPRLETRACYCSVLDECWEIHSRASRPQAVARCEAAGHISFND